MSLGVDAALGVAALSLTCLHGCIKGLAVLSKAVHYDQDTSSIRLQIELEQQRLFAWAEAAGLTQKPPTLQMSVNDAAFVPRILNQLEVLLSDLSQLKKRYQLKLKATSDAVSALDDDNSTLSKLGPKALASVQRASTVIFSRRKTPWPKLRWVVLDEKEVTNLLREVRGYTSHLENFLGQARQSELHQSLDAILREIVLNLDDHQKLGILGRESESPSSTVAIAATARLKQIRLKLEASEPCSPSIPLRSPNKVDNSSSDQKPELHISSPKWKSDISLKSMRLHIRFLTIPDAKTKYVSRSLAYYDDKLVVLEWRGGTWFDVTSLERRVDKVAAFLHNLEPSFHSLPCRGYVKDTESNRYGYVFDLPSKLQPSSPSKQSLQSAPSTSQLPSLWTLRDLFDRAEYIPSLNERFSIATTLLETLLNLHTTGWLHKQFSSENIIFVREDEGTDVNEFDFSSYSMYVAGYAYARADDPGEMTEPLVSEIEADLYRHPASMGKSRIPFRRSFDIFSVGCTLLEIGLWSRFNRILEHFSTEPMNSSDITLNRSRTFQEPSVFSLPRSLSTETAVERRKEENFGRSESFDNSLDLLELRHELLLLSIPKLNGRNEASVAKERTSATQYPCKILQALAAATGNAYTRTVEKLLSMEAIYAKDKETEDEDKEYALDLEIEALNTIKGISEML